jgi:hypothetical protein
VLAHEAQHQRHQHAATEGHRGADAQRALQARLQQRGQVVGFFELARDDPALLVIQQADLGRRDATRAAVKETRPEPLLELGDMLGGRGLGEPHVDRCLAERAGFDDADEKTNALDAIHARNVGPNGPAIPSRNI